MVFIHTRFGSSQTFTSEPGFDEEMPIDQEEGLVTLMRAELEEVPSYAERFQRKALCTCGVCDSCLLSTLINTVDEQNGQS